jgi:hypothetical protein
MHHMSTYTPSAAVGRRAVYVIRRHIDAAGYGRTVANAPGLFATMARIRAGVTR